MVLLDVFFLLFFPAMVVIIKAIDEDF